MPMVRDPVTGRSMGVDANGNGSASLVNGVPQQTFHATTPLSYGGSWGTTNPATGALPSANKKMAYDGTGAPVPTNQYGTESGPGIMEQWFGERANGTDPGYEYTTGRGMKALDNAYAARGMYNSGAATQGQSDFLANSGAQREGQLDQLAGAADASRNTHLATMLGLGTGLAGGEAGLGAGYDITGANAMGSANNTGLGYGAQASVIPYSANQNFMNQIFGLVGAGAGAAH